MLFFGELQLQLHLSSHLFAKRNGVRFGRPEREIPEEFDRIYELWKNEKISKREAARQLHTNHNTFSNWIKRQEKIVVEK